MDIASGRVVQPELIDMLGRAIRGIARPNLLLNLYFINNQINRMKSAENLSFLSSSRLKTEVSIQLGI
jgi:hypothetical protein